jgi:hypothetical protein
MMASWCLLESNLEINQQKSSIYSSPNGLPRWTVVLCSNSEDNWLFAKSLLWVVTIIFYPLQGHTFNFTVFCTLWTMVFHFSKESVPSVYCSQTGVSPKGRQETICRDPMPMLTFVCLFHPHCCGLGIGRELRKSNLPVRKEMCISPS